MIHFYTNLARFADAYAIGRQGVELFGIRLPTKFVLPLFLLDLFSVRWRLRRTPIASLVDLPPMTDEHRATALRLLVAVGKAAYQIDPRLNIAGQLKAVNLCLKFGNTPESALSYMAFGAIFEGGVTGNHQKGYDFGKLALALIERYNNERLRSEISFVVGYFATSWLRPAVEAEQLWQIAHDAGVRVGDLFHAGCACGATIMSQFMRGVPMQDILATSDQFLEFLNRAQLREPAGAITAVRQAIRNLRGLTRSRESFSDNAFDEEAYRTKLTGFGSRHLAHYYYVVKMQTLYLWGEYDQALAVAGNSAAYLKDSPGMLHTAEHHFYHALIVAALYPTSGYLQRFRQRWALRRIHKTMRCWAANCPDNFLHKEQLVAAEICRVIGKHDAAIHHYQAAIAAASKFGYVHIEALAHERAARLDQSRGDLAAGAAGLSAARACYRRWGANSYAAALRER
jgi:predicted ATPase